MAKVRDRFWLWTHEAGSWNSSIIKDSRMTPAEAAVYMGIPNILLVKFYNKPEVSMYEKYAISFRPFKNVVWSIVGAGGCSVDDNLNPQSDVYLIPKLAKGFPNIAGVIMDDFFTSRAKNYTAEMLSEMKKSLCAGKRKLDLWVTLYTHEMELPIKSHMEQIDVITFWTWYAKDLENLEKNFEQLKNLFPKNRKVLGCYMYDFGDGKEMPVNLMEKQCELGLKWLKAGDIEGMIFLGSCICDLKFETVEWTRKWIQKAGKEYGRYS